jgi:hypothetical protein
LAHFKLTTLSALPQADFHVPFRFAHLLQIISQCRNLMGNHAHQLVQKLWNYCNILREHDLSDSVKQVERRLSVVEELATVVAKL